MEERDMPLKVGDRVRMPDWVDENWYNDVHIGFVAISMPRCYGLDGVVTEVKMGSISGVQLAHVDVEIGRETLSFYWAAKDLTIANLAKWRRKPICASWK